MADFPARSGNLFGELSSIPMTACRSATIRAGAAGVIPSDEVEGLFVVTGGKAEFRRLRTGMTGLTHVEVMDGLEDGEEIVIGSYKVLRTIRSGARVKAGNTEVLN